MLKTSRTNCSKGQTTPKTKTAVEKKGNVKIKMNNNTMYLSRVIFTQQVTPNFPEKKQKHCSPEWRLGLPSAHTFPVVRGNYPLWVGLAE